MWHHAPCPLQHKLKSQPINAYQQSQTKEDCCLACQHSMRFSLEMWQNVISTINSSTRRSYKTSLWASAGHKETCDVESKSSDRAALSFINVAYYDGGNITVPKLLFLVSSCSFSPHLSSIPWNIQVGMEKKSGGEEMSLGHNSWIPADKYSQQCIMDVMDGQFGSGCPLFNFPGWFVEFSVSVRSVIDHRRVMDVSALINTLHPDWSDTIRCPGNMLLFLYIQQPLKIKWKWKSFWLSATNSRLTHCLQCFSFLINDWGQKLAY